jgi:hypothetical protein
VGKGVVEVPFVFGAAVLRLVEELDVGGEEGDVEVIRHGDGGEVVTEVGVASGGPVGGRGFVEKDFEFGELAVRAGGASLMVGEGEVVVGFPQRPLGAVGGIRDDALEGPVVQVLAQAALVVAVDADLDVAVVTGDAAEEQVDGPAAGDEPGVAEGAQDLGEGENGGEGRSDTVIVMSECVPCRAPMSPKMDGISGPATLAAGEEEG